MKTNLKAKIFFYSSGLFYVMYSGITILLAFVFQMIIDAGIEGDLSLLINGVILVLIALAVEFGLMMLAAGFRLSYAKEMLLSIKRNRLQFLFSSRLSAHSHDGTNELSFFTTDSDILNGSYINQTVRLAMYISSAVFALIALLWINWLLSIVVAAFTMLPVLATGIFGKGLNRRTKEYSDASAAYVDIVKECLDGKKDIVAYDKEDVFLSRHDKANILVEKSRVNNELFGLFANRTSEALGNLTFVLTIALGTYFVITGDMTVGAVIAVNHLMGTLMRPLTSIASTINSIKSTKAIRVKTNEAIEPELQKSSISGFNNSIRVEDLSLRYFDDAYVVQGVNLVFNKGKKYAILAPSGYGKSSIAKALAMEFTGFEGAIFIDNSDMRSIDNKSYNQIVKYVRQDPYLFSDTALNNLLFFDNMSDENEFENILRTARIKEFLPDEEALHRHISNNSGLSGGQKQRIVLARALLHKPKILILDEITSGIDLETASDILTDIFTDKDLTCIVITHESNESFLSLFDEVMCLDKS